MVQIDGRDWSKHQAERAFPILVQWAERRRKGSYQELSRLLGIHHKPLPMALGTLGRAIQRLNESSESKPWSSEIPPIELLVCNKQLGVPGDLGLKWLSRFDKSVDYNVLRKLPLSLKRERVALLHETIFGWPSWRQVLAYFKLTPLLEKLPDLTATISQVEELFGHGESDGHKRLRIYLYLHPEEVGFGKLVDTKTEHLILSGDRLDVFFRTAGKWLCLEVKPANAPTADLIRGLFQCVKYKAVLIEQQKYERAQNATESSIAEIEVRLALAGKLPSELKPLQEMLGVKIMEKVVVPEHFKLPQAMKAAVAV